jgi:hypothetical protein
MARHGNRYGTAWVILFFSFIRCMTSFLLHGLQQITIMLHYNSLAEMPGMENTETSCLLKMRRGGALSAAPHGDAKIPKIGGKK